MPTIAERLLAGEHHGCSSWADVAAKLGCHERSMRCIRALLRAQGWKDELVPNSGSAQPNVGILSGFQENTPRYANAERPLDNGAVSRCESASRGDDYHAELKREWPSVAAFDAYTPEEQQADSREAHALAPDGYHVKGVSTLYDGDGLVRARWVKTNRHSDPLADIVEAFASIKDELPQSNGPIAAPARCNTKQLAAYLYGDCHVGMHAWRGDAGSNFDLKIAEQNLTELTSQLVDLAPPTERALIVNIGDYFHADNRGNTTTKGTPVDVDGRWAKVLAVGIRIMRRNIERALQKHQHVTVINEIGNHDTHTSIFLSLALAQFYENEPRVTIDCSSEMFHYFRFGKVLIMTHHGHQAKPADLPGIMAVDRREWWGETLWRYIFTGHIHHERSREFPGANWRSLRATATADAWHQGQGYRSSQELSLEIFDEDAGLINRHNVGVPKNLGAAV